MTVAPALDLAHPELLAEELEQAAERLAREPQAPAAVLALVDELAERILGQDARRVGAAGVDAGLWIDLQQVARRAVLAVRADEDPRRQRRELRVLVEGMRFLLARIAEREALGDERPVRDVVAWLDGALTVSQAEKARLLGVALRTYQRWLAGTAAPGGDDERRVRLVARVVLDLRSLLTGPGAADWLRRGHRALGGRTPLQVIEDGDERRLARLLEVTGAARAGAAG